MSSATTTSTFRIAPADGIPHGARVCHYDELEEPAKERLPSVVGTSGTTTTDPAFEDAAGAWDLVKFTDYYRIDRV